MLRSNARVRRAGSPPSNGTIHTAELVAPRQALSWPTYAMRVPSGAHAGMPAGPIPRVSRRGGVPPSVAMTQISVTLVRSASALGLAAYAIHLPSGDQAGL